MPLEIKPPIAIAGLDTQFHVIEDVPDFLQLEDEWDSLWSNCAGQSYESFFFCHQCLVHNLSAQNGQLWCLTGRQNGKLTLVWPLIISRQGLWKIMRPLSSGGPDPTVFLVEGASNNAAVVGAAWKIVTSRTGADILKLPYIREDRLLYAHLPKLNGRSSATLDHAPLALLKKETSWDEYCRLLCGKRGKQQKYIGRRIAREGQVAIETYGSERPEQCDEVIDWILFHKKNWAARTGKKGPWLNSTAYRDLLVSLLKRAPQRQPYFVLAMTLNEKRVAACLIAESPNGAGVIITAYDDAYSKLSPGAAMFEHAVRSAFDHRLDMDLGVGAEPYKRFWSKDNLISTVSLTIPVSAWGRSRFWARELVGRPEKSKGK
jgi:CelD/BcsL family acetyltransferase involved in cellulose biosynthesis